MTEQRPITLDHLRSAKKPVTRRAYIANDEEVAERFEEAAQKVARLEARHRILKDPDDRKQVEQEKVEAEAELEAAREELKANANVFVFSSIGPKNFDDLIAENPPTKEQLDKVEEAGGDPKELGWNPDTFAPALLAKSCKSHSLSKEEWASLWEDPNWNSAELGDLFNTALLANTQKRQIELAIQGNGSGGAKKRSKRS